MDSSTESPRYLVKGKFIDHFLNVGLFVNSMIVIIIMISLKEAIVLWSFLAVIAINWLYFRTYVTYISIGDDTLIVRQSLNFATIVYYLDTVRRIELNRNIDQKSKLNITIHHIEDYAAEEHADVYYIDSWSDAERASAKKLLWSLNIPVTDHTQTSDSI